MQSDLVDRLLVAREALSKRPIRLHEAAQLACVSPFHFHRSFVELFGQTPHGFSMAKRILRGRDLLQNTDTPISVIAMDLGFNSHVRFAMAFSQHVGCSPTQFRQESRRFWSVSGYRSHAFIPMCFLGFRA